MPLVRGDHRSVMSYIQSPPLNVALGTPPGALHVPRDSLEEVDNFSWTLKLVL